MEKYGFFFTEIKQNIKKEVSKFSSFLVFSERKDLVE